MRDPGAARTQPGLVHQLGPVLALFCVAYLVYTTGLAVYNLFLSPLAKFPGSKLAAATSWYEFYYDYWLDGQYIFEIERMHKKYGPIIRVNPDELSIHDPAFYNEIYVTESKRRTNAYDVFCKGIDFDGSHLLTADHDLHRRRRKPLEPFFSRMGIARLQPMLAEVALHLETRLRDLKGSGKVIRLDHAFSAFSGDIIGRICLDGGSGGSRFLDDPDFAPDWYNVIHAIVRSIPLFTGFPWLVRVVSWIPESVLLWAYPRGQMFNIFKERAKQHIRRAMTSATAAHGAEKGHEEDASSLFHHIVNKSDMPESERSEERLSKEAQVLLGGGTASTARTIGFASFYILSRPAIRARLEAELSPIMASWPTRVPSWAELERLAFLQAIIKESLRLSYGVMHRLPRISPDVPIQYKNYTILPGAPVGMSAYLMHSDPDVFASPGEFTPERWLRQDTIGNMNKSFVPFCRGSRNCLGMNLAMAEMSLILAVLFRPNGPEFDLFETDESDIRQAHDFLIPLPKITTKGVRALIR
ncbi:cytochrome P450 [Lasiosphaeria miniovina]|uniref:Cytochrome P450 n=1 Tax=Lasiosphaeria miniovina TaxID=1954250 RepID=A0AA39ZQQ1_9PEZI|nr:cytochrome P450 [Lasiosphaeria miniovina]KAK0701924.1 cytochrome P450 [Lasiosphaeria miniovina]